MICKNAVPETEGANDGKIFEKLIKLSGQEQLQVKFASLLVDSGRIKGDRIVLGNNMTIVDINYILAHELAHHFLHYDKGNTVNSSKVQEYEEQADRAAKMLLDALAV